MSYTRNSFEIAVDQAQSIIGEDEGEVYQRESRRVLISLS